MTRPAAPPEWIATNGVRPDLPDGTLIHAKHKSDVWCGHYSTELVYPRGIAVGEILWSSMEAYRLAEGQAKAINGRAEGLANDGDYGLTGGSSAPAASPVQPIDITQPGTYEDKAYCAIHGWFYAGYPKCPTCGAQERELIGQRELDAALAFRPSRLFGSRS